MSDPDVGPVISQRQQRGVEHYLALAHDSELRIAAQAGLPAGLPARGHCVRPTLFDAVPADHALAQQEIFGPVQVLIAFEGEGEGEALPIANGTAFGLVAGLVAGVWTRDGGRQMRMAHALKCGQVFINNYGAGGGVELPFGGVKLSGHGREKGFEALYGDCSAPADQFHTIKLYAADRECIERGTSPIRSGWQLRCRSRARATPRHATPRHATPSASVTAAMTKGSTCSRVCLAATRSACLRCRPPNGHRSTGRCQPGPHARARRGRVRCPGSPRSARARGRHRSAIARGLRSGCR